MPHDGIEFCPGSGDSVVLEETMLRSQVGNPEELRRVADPLCVRGHRLHTFFRPKEIRREWIEGSDMPS